MGAGSARISATPQQMMSTPIAPSQAEQTRAPELHDAHRQTDRRAAGQKQERRRPIERGPPIARCIGQREDGEQPDGADEDGDARALQARTAASRQSLTAHREPRQGHGHE